MNKQGRHHISAARQRIASLIKAADQLIEVILAIKVVTKGTICEKKRKCGKLRCKCAQGEPHRTKILSISHRGKSRIVHLSRYTELELNTLERQVKEYQKYRRARAKLVSYFKMLLQEINSLEHRITMEVALPSKGGDNENKEENERH